MKIAHINSKTPLIVLPAALCFAVAIALAVPFHAPLVDGVITRDGVDWDPADLVVNDQHDDNPLGTANVRRVLCTWSADSLYLGVTYQDFGGREAFKMYVDLDRGTGPDDATLLDTGAGNFLMPDGHRFELVLARDPADGEDFFNGPPPTVHLVNSDDGTTTDLGAAVNAQQAANTGTKQAGGEAARFAFWANAEIAIPWSALYPGLNGKVPAHAVIKAVAVAATAAADSNGYDAAPDNDGMNGDGAQVLLENMHASIVDADGDGVPDPSDATISGTVTLPSDPGTGTVTVTAEITGFAGRDPGAPLSIVTTADGERTWTLPRLAAGSYLVKTEATGYFSDTQTIQVSQSQQVTDINQTLDKATAIGGSITFLSGPGGAGVATLEDTDGQVIDTQDFAFDAAGGSYRFFVETGGQYTVAITADTYQPQDRAITVVTSVDQLDVDFALIRQNEISGSVGFESGPGAAGTVRLFDPEGAVRDSSDFAFSGGTFEYFVSDAGQYRVAASAKTYVTTDTTMTISQGQDVTGISLIMPRAASVSGQIAFEGPDAPGRLELYDNVTGAWRDSSSFSATGDPVSFFLEPGQFRIEMEATGYEDLTTIFDVTLADTSLGDIQLIAVRATHLEIVDGEGNTLPEVRATAYNPATDPWTSSRLVLAARDDLGRDDIYDLDDRLTNFKVTARKMDDLSPTTGTPVFYRTDRQADVDSVFSFSQGRLEFWASNTAVEVLRVYLAQPDKEPIAGRIVVAFLNPQPRLILLTVDRDTLTADDVDLVTVSAKLFDSALNESKIPDIPVSWSVLNTSSGVGQFEVPTTVTNGAGEAVGRVTATGSGNLHVSASVVINNRVLDVAAYELASGETFATLVSLPGITTGWRLNLPSNQADVTSPVSVVGQTIDQFGNPTPDPGQGITFTADPSDLGAFDPVTATSDATGRATSTFTPSGTSGVVFINGQGSGLSGDASGMQLRNVTVIPDPVWYEEPEGHKTFEKTDLTAVIVDNTPESLILEIPFASDWNGLQLHLAFETNFDAAGATSDPFTQPVNYGHDLKPDYVLTSKYSANDYGDFRRWNGTGWDFWNPGSGAYGSDGNVQPVWVDKGAERVMIRIPRGPFGGTFPDSLMIEAYLTQDDGEKRSAFDSAPQDATLNLTFDPEDPQPGDWDIAKGPVTLSNWGRTYVTKTDFPVAPTVSEIVVEPGQLNAGDVFVLNARVTDGGDGIGNVLADLSAMGGGELTRMYDDGDAGHGDATAGDGIYSVRTLVPTANPGGIQKLVVNAYDGANVWAQRASTTVQVIAQIVPIIEVLDEIGDDHGPNQPGNSKLFYTYPTNIAFVSGGFDLTGLTVFETVANVGGQSVEMIAFQISMVDFPDPADPGTADWSPLYADLNINKIDILIDSAPGGATATLPWRQAAFQPWDAWEYAVIIDGWYKAVVPSEGQNTLDSWRKNALRSDKDILLLSDPDLDTVTALVSKAALKNPTLEDIKSWDICVAMCSHDFGGEEVLGGIRWVDESRSEWRFGGGHQENRDSNYLDLMLIPGTGHSPGLTQEEILNYESPEAVARLEAQLTPVAIEMSKFEDTGPPVIDTGGEGSVVTRVAPIQDTPLALSLVITDDFRVRDASFRYRSTGFAGEGWDREVPMGFLGRDRWIVDILPSWLDSNLVYSPIDSTRYLEFEVEASDALGKTTISPVTTLQIFPYAICRPNDTTLNTESLALLQVDGSALLVEDRTRKILLNQHINQAWTGGEVDPDTMGRFVELQWDVCNISEAVKRAPVVPEGVPLGVFRQVFLATADTLGGYLDYPDKFPGDVQLSLHYPQEWVPAGVNEDLIALYEYNPQSNRWILVGGNVTPTGNNVTATIGRVATYGLFATSEVSHNAGEVISGITLSPNPFSPNGDDLYDETNISFYLTQEATVTVEIYNIEGHGKRTLTETFSFASNDATDPRPRRVPGLVWDGRDSAGNLVPYGIYIVRVVANYTQAGTTRTVRSNHSLAVIR